MLLIFFLFFLSYRQNDMPVHFHCPVCNMTVIQRGDMATQLLSCQHSGLLPTELSVEPHLPLDVLSPASKPFSESSVEHSCALPSVLNETVACGKSMKMKRPHCGLSLLTKKLQGSHDEGAFKQVNRCLPGLSSAVFLCRGTSSSLFFSLQRTWSSF